MKTLARLYTQCIDLEEQARVEAPSLAEDLAVMRADLHALWMQALRESNIAFSDRAEAAQLAYELLNK